MRGGCSDTSFIGILHDLGRGLQSKHRRRMRGEMPEVRLALRQAIAAMYASRYGIHAVCVRILSCF